MGEMTVDVNPKAADTKLIESKNDSEQIQSSATPAVQAVIE